MIPLMARKYIYRYLVIAIAMPILARLLIMAGLQVEKRSGKPNIISKSLKKVGALAQRRAAKSSGKHSER